MTAALPSTQHRLNLGPGVAWLVLAAVLASPASAQTRTLAYTAPCFTMHVWRDWDEQKQDSVTNIDCHPGLDSLRETLTIYLWKRPMGAGQFFTRADSARVQPCLEDSFPGQGAGHYYVTARNSVGEACGSGQADILPSVMTGVGIAEVRDPIVSCALYDVQGRRVAALSYRAWYDAVVNGRALRLPSGIYFLRGTTLGRTVRVRRVVVVR